jgi:hypothetical protein
MVYALIVLLCFGCASVGHAELDLSPKFSYYELDGLQFRKLVFVENGREVTYVPPRDWDYSGSATRLILHPPRKAQAEAAITTTSLPSGTGLDEAATNTLVNETLRSVPVGSTHIAVISQERNPLLIAGKETFFVSVTYIFYGETYTRSVLFLNRASEQMRFQLISRSSDFEELQAEFQRSLYSWKNL